MACRVGGLGGGGGSGGDGGAGFAGRGGFPPPLNLSGSSREFMPDDFGMPLPRTSRSRHHCSADLRFLAWRLPDSFLFPDSPTVAEPRSLPGFPGGATTHEHRFSSSRHRLATLRTTTCFCERFPASIHNATTTITALAASSTCEGRISSKDMHALVAAKAISVVPKLAATTSEK